MSKVNLPLKVDPVRFAEHATHLHGYLPIKDMERLCASLASNQGDIKVDLEFGIDEQNIRFMKGHVETHLTLQCQRCMEPFDYEILDDFVLGMVQMEGQVDELPSDYDPLIIKDVELFIPDVIEDELIVSLPIVAMHDIQHCKVKLPLVAETEPMSKKENPFKVIESLRRNK